jgi:hypothetical protein
MVSAGRMKVGVGLQRRCKRPVWPRRLAPHALTTWFAALALSGCVSGADTGGDANSGLGTKIGNVLAFGTPNPPPVAPKPVDKTQIDCPEVEVLGGAASLRVGGQDNAAVRYQYSMGEVARECAVEDGKINIKVGVEGRVLLGPAGSPGSFQVPIRIAIRQEADQKPALSKAYRVAAAIAPGETQTTFDMVSEPLQVPYLRARADEDYTIVVGFDEKVVTPEPTAKRRKR